MSISFVLCIFCHSYQSFYFLAWNISLVFRAICTPINLCPLMWLNSGFHFVMQSTDTRNVITQGSQSLCKLIGITCSIHLFAPYKVVGFYNWYITLIYILFRTTLMQCPFKFNSCIALMHTVSNPTFRILYSV